MFVEGSTASGVWGSTREHVGSVESSENKSKNKPPTQGKLLILGKVGRISDTRGESWLSFTREQNKKGTTYAM